MSQKKIIVYDFDKTLTKKDTLFGFFIFNAKKSIGFYFKILYYFLSMILAKTNFISNRSLKNIGIKLFLSNLGKEQLRHKFINYKSQISFNFLFDELKYNEKCDYYIISASFEEYVRPIFPNFVNVFGSTISYKNNIAYSLLFNCYKKNKVQLLQQKGLTKIDVLFTDSFSDYALAKMAKKIFIVSKNQVICCDSISDFNKYFNK